MFRVPRPSGGADNLLAVEEAPRQHPAEEPHRAEIAKLCYCAGLNAAVSSAVLGMSASTLAREGCFARAWLVRRRGDTPAGARRVDD
jgi:hypothetical protein